MSKQVGVVIARYLEDVYWLHDLNPNYKIYLYNKGDYIATPYISLPNVGREAHTYLYHIIENYDNLDEFTVFIQADPFDHGVSYNLMNFLDFSKDFIPFICPDYLSCNENCHPHWEYDLISFCNKYEIKYEIPFKFIQGAQFCVRENLIRKHKKSFYVNLLESLNDENPDEAYALERVWYYIFNF